MILLRWWHFHFSIYVMSGIAYNLKKLWSRHQWLLSNHRIPPWQPCHNASCQYPSICGLSSCLRFPQVCYVTTFKFCVTTFKKNVVSTQTIPFWPQINMPTMKAIMRHVCNPESLGCSLVSDFVFCVTILKKIWSRPEQSFRVDGFPSLQP